MDSQFFEDESTTSTSDLMSTFNPMNPEESHVINMENANEDNNDSNDSSGFFDDNQGPLNITIESVVGAVDQLENQEHQQQAESHRSLEKPENEKHKQPQNEEQQQPENHGSLEKHRKENEPQAVPESSNQSSFDESSVWYNGSEFTCKICANKTFYERQNLENHLRFKHRKLADKYEDEYGCLETKTKVYECQICHQSVKQVRSVIVRHLRRLHDEMSIEQYAQDYVQINNLPVISSSESLSEDSTIEDKNAESVKDNSSTVIQDKKAEVEDLQREIKEYFDHCRYECRICGVVSTNAGDAVKHFKKSHDKLTVKAYEKLYGDKRTFSVELSCQICHQTLKRDSFSFRGHIYMVHREEVKSLEEYYRKYCREENLQALKTAEKENVSSAQNSRAAVNAKNVQIQREEVAKPSLPKMRNYDRVTLVDLDADQPQEGQNNKEADSITEEAQIYFNHCSYKCTICDGRFTELEKAGHHVTKVHRRRKPESFTQRVKIAYHDCKICRRNILRSVSTMSEHLQNLHTTDIQNYYDEYIKEDNTLGFFDACEYACALCDHFTNSRAKATSHVNNSHGITVGDYFSLHGPLMTKEVKMACEICKGEGPKDKLMFTVHLGKFHKNLSLKEYYKNYVEKKRPSKRFILASPEDGRKRQKMEFNNNEKAKELLSPPIQTSSRRKNFQSQQVETPKSSRERSIPNVDLRNINLATVSISAVQKKDEQVSRTVKNLKVEKVEAQKPTRADSKKLNILKKPEPVKPMITPQRSIKPPTPKKRVHSPETKPAPINKRSRTMTRVSANQKVISNTELTAPLEEWKKWANQCKYACQLCNDQTNVNFSFVPELSKHLKFEHNIFSIQQYQKHVGSRIMTKLVKHKCKLCQESFDLTEPSAQDHLWKHRKTLAQYFKDYKVSQADLNKSKQQQSKAQNEIKITPNHKESPVIQSNKTYRNNSRQKQKTLENDSQSQDGKDWMNGCTYKCALCSNIFHSKVDIYTHVEKSHRTPAENYVLKYGDPMVSVGYYDCKLCGQKVINDAFDLSTHFTETHFGLKLQEYQNTFHNGDSNVNERQAVQQLQQQQKFEWNRCYRTCEICGPSAAIFRTQSDFFQHRNKVHKHTKVTAKFTKVNHTCMICGQDTLCDRDTVSRHLVSKHSPQFNLENYEERFRQELNRFFNALDKLENKVMVVQIPDEITLEDD